MISAGTGFAPAAGGMTTYYEGLAATLPAVDGVDGVLAFVAPGVTHARIDRPGIRVLHCSGLGSSRPRRVAYEHLAFARAVRRAGADVLLSTHNVRPLTWRGPSVVVLQSMQYFFLPDPISRLRRAYLELSVPRSLRAAHRVIAVSEAARQDAIELFSLDPERIVAVHHGCSPWALEAAERIRRHGRPPVPPPLDPQRPYAAIVSSLYGLKNHARLIEAFGEAVRAGVDHDLVIAGREYDVTHDMLRGVARRAGVEDRVRLLGAYPQEHLPALLANADAVVYPSLYETFGHPVLEAFAFARPLLTSDRGGTAEVAGEAAVLVDPYDVQAMGAGLVRLLGDEQERERLVAAGTRRLADFDWALTARGTAAALRAAVDAA